MKNRRLFLQGLALLPVMALPQVSHAEEEATPADPSQPPVRKRKKRWDQSKFLFVGGGLAAVGLYVFWPTKKK